MRFACVRCAAGGHFVSPGAALRAPGVALINYKGDSIPKIAYPTTYYRYLAKNHQISQFLKF